jgi:iron(III) transport system ATP-binding protein
LTNLYKTLSPFPFPLSPTLWYIPPLMVTIAIDHLSKQFPDRSKPGGVFTAVDDVSLTIASGSLFFLLGPSGCGKTTLLRMIAGFTLPDAGTIRFDSQDMTRVPPYLRDTGMVFQSYALWPHMTIADNVGFGLDVRHITGDARKQRILESLTLVQMDHLADRKPNQLSGGQQQRIALARALAIRPKCLLLDEPLSNLDAKLRLEMRAEIRRIVKSTGITAVYVTHDQKEALSMADNIAVLKDGKLQQFGTPLDLYKRPATKFVADFIGESNFLPATIASVSATAIILNTPVGPLTASVPSGNWKLETGSSVSAAFRPESVGVSVNGAPGDNTVTGRRLSTTYLGEMAEHIIELPGGIRIKAFELNPAMITATAETCTLTIPPENLMVVPDEK